MPSTDPNDGGRPRPQVYARLAHDAEERFQLRSTPRWSRPAGWLLVLAIAVMVVVAAFRAHPW